MRARIQKQLEKSAVAGSMVVTDVSNEQGYLAPSTTDGDVLTIVAGVPAWDTSASDTLTSLVQNVTTGVITYTDEVAGTSTANVVSTDANNAISVGSDGGAYYDAPDVITGATWDDANNQLVLSFTEGVDVNVPIVDAVANFIHTHTLSDGTNTTDITNGDTIVYSGTQGVTVTVSTDAVAIGLPAGSADGDLLVWNDTASEYEAQTPTALTEQTDSFTALASGTDVTLSQTPNAGANVVVSRNGLEQLEGTDYTLTGTTVSFSTAFDVSSGAAGSETVIARYKY